MTTTETTIKEKEVLTTETTKEVKFSKEEMDSIAAIKQRYDAVTVRMGQLAVEEMALRHSKEAVENEYKSLRKEETDYAASLSEKYGAGQLNLDTGVFIASE